MADPASRLEDIGPSHLTTSASLAAAEAARRDGNPLAVFDIAQSAIGAGAGEARFRYLQVLALAQMGDAGHAEQAYERLGLTAWTDDEDAVALRGRLLKDRARAASGPERQALFEQASAAYLRAYAIRSGYFPAINAAATAWAAGERVRARALAEEVLRHPELNPPESFFAAASRAEALMLLGRLDEAVEVIGKAVRTGDVGYGERGSAYRQMAWLCAEADLSPGEQQPLLDALRPPPVITYTGHMARVCDGEGALAARISAEIDALGSTIAYGALACGADILFAEEILRRGGELNVVLPFQAPDFVEASVRPGGEAWVERFEACLRQAASVEFATRMDYVGDDGQLAYGSLLAMGLAQLRAGQISARAVQLAVWDGQPARGDAGAAVDVAAWRALGRETHIIEPGGIDRQIASAPAPSHGPEIRRAVRAVAFTDYKGFSRLSEAAIPVFVRDVMGPIAAVLDAHREAVCARNTWGDALYAVITDTVAAADIVLEIVETLQGVRLGQGGSEPEGMRIGLHFGPVYQVVDPVTGVDSFYGSEVTLAARIEPTAIPGEVYTTRAFAAILAATEPRRFASRYIGQIELAKGYGALPIYRLTRRSTG
jgi:hypothetical protein